MGNTVSKVVDYGMRAACVLTNGNFGKSDDGYHVGPLRLNGDSAGFTLNAGIAGVGFKVGRNEFGKYGIEFNATCGIPAIGSLSLKGGYDKDGYYGGICGTLNVGPAKGTVGIVADSKGSICSYDAGVTGPLLTNVQYSKEGGLSVGAFGCSVDEAGNVDGTQLKNAAINYTGERIRAKYQGKKEREKYETHSKEADENNKREETKNDKMNGNYIKKGKKGISTDYKDADENRRNEIGINCKNTDFRKSTMNRSKKEYNIDIQLQRAQILETEITKRPLEVKPYCEVCKGPCRV